ncbi:MAG: hypothetical protein E2P07_05810 [Acidobacteria bacterium]|nr:MAG: hypothetical protein E2P07_05810 [Acidobacteriota bacterium]
MQQVTEIYGRENGWGCSTYHFWSGKIVFCIDPNRTFVGQLQHAGLLLPVVPLATRVNRQFPGLLFQRQAMSLPRRTLTHASFAELFQNAIVGDHSADHCLLLVD